MAPILHLAGLLGPSTDSTGSNAGVQLSALHLLARLVRMSHVAAAAVLSSRRQVLGGLMAVVLATGSLRPVTPATGGAKGAAKPTTGPDAAKQVSCSRACWPYA
jgi:hypothetical protein